MAENDNELDPNSQQDETSQTDPNQIPFTNDSWIESSNYKNYYKRIALTVWTSIVGYMLYSGLQEHLQAIVQTYQEVGLQQTISTFLSPAAQWSLGAEAVFFLAYGLVLMSMAWWGKKPVAPPTPTVITWVIFVLGTITLLIGEILGAIGTAGWTLFFWIVLSIAGFLYFILWLFQPWFEYWRHLYCRWVFLWERDCGLWIANWKKTCAAWQKKESKDCKDWLIKRILTCITNLVTRKRRCATWKSTTSRACSSWHWSLSWICRTWSYVTTWLCDAWTWVTFTSCVAWAWVVERLCTLWVTVVTFLCYLWAWIVTVVCAVWFFILKLIMLCWWR